MIKIGDKVPDLYIKYMHNNQIKNETLQHFCKGKKMILIGVPGAYTPVCTLQHVPGFVKNKDAFKALGIEGIACLSVNDPFVMDAWGDACHAKEHMTMIGDPYGEVTKSLGLEVDLIDAGLGARSQRYVMVLDDCKVQHLFVEDAADALTTTKAEYVLAHLDD